MRIRFLFMLAALSALVIAAPAWSKPKASTAMEHLALLSAPAAPPPQAFTAGASHQICFTPGEDCEGLIVATIHRARKQLLMIAYSFTNKAIAQALIDAKKRGVDAALGTDGDLTEMLEFFGGVMPNGN